MAKIIMGVFIGMLMANFTSYVFQKAYHDECYNYAYKNPLCIKGMW